MFPRNHSKRFNSVSIIFIHLLLLLGYFFRLSHRFGQKCCYNNVGNLTTSSPFAATIDVVSPSVNLQEHFAVDILPRVYCCPSFIGLCQQYYILRPSDNCSRYIPSGKL